MPFLRTAFSTASKTILFVPILIFFLVILCHGSAVKADSTATNTSTMPTTENPLIIGVPRGAFSDNFVKITPTNDPDKKIYEGFCIRVFEKVVKILEEKYPLPYKFVEFNGSYSGLVAEVASKTFGAAVGDITILAERWNDVEFTVPFTESGLSMVVPLKASPKAWRFLKPFTVEMWLLTGALLIYTMFIVWFLEHQSNPEFRGLGNALWFTCSALFLAHGEKIQSSYTRVVVVVWLFVALVLTQSYTASLTSMLTVSQLQPSFKSQKRTQVGCDETTFMRKYMEDVLGYKSENVKPMSYQFEYLRAFEDGSISAAFLEIPYAKVFVNNYCKKYCETGTTYRFGGFGFVFQKGSPIAADASEAILKLSEDGTLKGLEEQWLTPSSECSDPSEPTKDTHSLSLQSFSGLYLFSCVTCAICLLAHFLKNYRQYHKQLRVDDINASDESFKNKTNAETGSSQASQETVMR